MEPVFGDSVYRRKASLGFASRKRQADTSWRQHGDGVCTRDEDKQLARIVARWKSLAKSHKRAVSAIVNSFD